MFNLTGHSFKTMDKDTAIRYLATIDESDIGVWYTRDPMEDVVMWDPFPGKDQFGRDIGGRYYD